MRGVRPSSRRSYIVILCLVALGILVAGVALRPQSTAAPVRTESEFLQLQLLAQRRDMERRSLYFQTKADQLVARSQDSRAHPDQSPYVRPRNGRVILLVATDSSGQPVWATATVVGSSETACDGRAIEEIESTITIPRILTNAAAFDLEEGIAGFVVSCGGRRVLTTAAGFKTASQPTLTQQLQTCCGLQVSDTNDGIEITQLAAISRVADAGAKLGDRIIEINGQPLESVDQLLALLQDSPTVLSVRRGRSRRLLQLTVPAAAAEAGTSAQ